MKRNWLLWVLIIGGIAGIFFAFNYQRGNNSASLTEIFPEDQALPKDVEYEFVDGAQVEQAAQTVITQNLQGQTSQQVAAQAAAAPVQAKAIQTAASTSTQAKAAASPSAQINKTAASATTQAKAAVSTTTQAAATLTKTDLTKIPFTIQVASFKEKIKADKILSEAKAKNFPAYLTSKSLDSGTWYRIYIGEFKTKSEADQYLTQVKPVYQGSFVIAPK